MVQHHLACHIVVYTLNNNTLKASPLDCSVNQDHNSSQPAAIPHPLYVKKSNSYMNYFSERLQNKSNR